MMKSEHLKWVLNPWLMIIALVAAALYVNQEQLFGEPEAKPASTPIEVAEEAVVEAEPAPEAAPEEAPEPEVDVEPVVETPPEPAPEPQSEPQDSTEQFEQYMNSARQAARQGDWAAAVAAYRLAAKHDADGYLAEGELGNLYFSRGNMQEAAEAYLQAAQALRAAGHPQAIWPMLPVIEQQLPQQGYALRRELLSGVTPNTP